MRRGEASRSPAVNRASLHRWCWWCVMHAHERRYRMCTTLPVTHSPPPGGATRNWRDRGNSPTFSPGESHHVRHRHRHTCPTCPDTRPCSRHAPLQLGRLVLLGARSAAQPVQCRRLSVQWWWLLRPIGQCGSRASEQPCMRIDHLKHDQPAVAVPHGSPSPCAHYSRIFSLPHAKASMSAFACVTISSDSWAGARGAPLLWGGGGCARRACTVEHAPTTRLPTPHAP